MPVNKAARIRHEILDACLRNTTQHWTKKKLLNFLNKRLIENYGPEASISLSQIRNDLADMQSIYGAPIEKRHEGAIVYYFYEDPTFSIVKLPIEDKDMAILHLAVHLLKQIEGFSIADEISAVLEKMENKIQFSSDSLKPVIGFENAPLALGTENLVDIYRAIIGKKVLKIKYRHFRASEATEQIIHPYYLKEYNNRWFLFGWSEQNNRIEILALDRMGSIRVTAGYYKENIVFDPEVYFSNIVGVTNIKEAAVEDIELLFSTNRAPYVTTKPIHSSQKTIKKYADGSLLVGLSLVINKELKSLILGFGNDVEVRKPESLRKEIKDFLGKAFAHY